MSTAILPSPAPATSLETAESPVRFHLSINVSDLNKSVAFYRAIFGCEPAKCRADYAKFELDEPPLVMSLEPRAPGSAGMLNHAGFRFPNSQRLVDAQRRLEMAGIATQREEGVECCYSRQTKFWARDPDQCLWEFYVLEEDIEHRGEGQSKEHLPTSAPVATVSPAATVVPAAPQGPVWEHRMMSPLPERIPGDSNSYGEIRLRGTLNEPLKDGRPQALFAEAFRALQPGGQLQIHVLTAASEFKTVPQLPGPAAVVKAVPVDREVIAALEQAGFQRITLTKFKPQPCFRFDGVELRETMLTAFKPAAIDHALPGRVVVYKGPFAAIIDDSGRTYRRGEHVAVPACVHEALMAASPEQFVSLDTPVGGDAISCGTTAQD